MGRSPETACCDACGTALAAVIRCTRCRTVTTSCWLACTALLGWLSALALYWSVSQVMYADIARIYAGLGSQTPLPARLYFAVSDPASYPIAAVALLSFPALLAASRENAGRLRVWARCFALSAGLGWAWAALGLVAWWLSVKSIISTLS
jgi:hypothetical protein